MEPLKKDAINIIINLPDDADMEEIMYMLYVLENIRRGQEDAEKGRAQLHRARQLPGMSGNKKTLPDLSDCNPLFFSSCSSCSS